MSKSANALLLVGSPKGYRSTSFALGNYLVHSFEEKGLTTQVATIENMVSSPDEEEKLLASITSCDLLIIATPLYVDSLPAVLIKALELLRDNRLSDQVEERKRTLLLAIVNSGFPEAAQCNTALGILRRFAVECGFYWAGGLALGGGGAIEGKALKTMGGMVRNVTKSLDEAAQAVAEGRSISQKAVDLMAKPMVAGWMLSAFGGMMWRWQAKKYGAHKRLNDRPYD